MIQRRTSSVVMKTRRRSSRHSLNRRNSTAPKIKVFVLWASHADVRVRPSGGDKIAQSRVAAKFSLRFRISSRAKHDIDPCRLCAELKEHQLAKQACFSCDFL